MVRNRLLLLALGGFVLTPAAWGDEVGYVDCPNHPEETQVLAKAAKTQESVATLPCGERFAILQSGFFFTRIQTKDGKIGFIYTNLISRDFAANGVPQAQPAQPPLTPAKMAARSSNPIASIASVFKPKAPPAQSLRVPAPPAGAAAPAAKAPQTAAPAAKTESAKVMEAQPLPPEPAVQSAPADTSLFPAKSNVIVQSEAAATVQPQPVPVEPAAKRANRAPAVASNFPAKSAVVVQSEVTPTANATPAPPPTPEPAAPAPAVSTYSPEPRATVSPEPIAPASAEPASAEPAPASFQPESPKPSWRKPDRVGSSRGTPLVELFGGYSYARMIDAGTTNLSGGLGSVAWNATSWLQLVADSSYNVVTATGVKNILYGNHYGPRLFWHRRNRWGVRPFVEGLVGGTRADTKVSGTGGYSASAQSISYKVGGGVDIRTSRYLEIRLFDVDYYRTTFTGGAKPYQNNYWASAGIILRLFGGGNE